MCNQFWCSLLMWLDSYKIMRLFGFDICMTLLKIAKISEPDCIRKSDDYDIQL